MKYYSLLFLAFSAIAATLGFTILAGRTAATFRLVSFALFIGFGIVLALSGKIKRLASRGLPPPPP